MSNKVNKTALKAILAALTSAGVATYMSRERSKEKRRKALDPLSSSNAIVVPIYTAKFMEGIKTPEEQARETSETVKLLGAPSLAQAPETPEGLASLKKDILKRNRKFDFFKAASDDSGEAVKPDGKDDELSNEPDRKTKDGKEDFSDAPRDDKGRFVSPTDPVGVANREKKAEVDILKNLMDVVVSPKKTWNGLRHAATKESLATVAGGAAAVYLATKLVDAIGKKRAENSKRNAELAQDEYVKMLQKVNEKEAQAPEAGYVKDNNIISMGAYLWGLSALAPLAISAVITDKVMENRKREREKRKNSSSSFPKSSYIFYKTSEDKSLKLSPESALAMIQIKRAMILGAEEMQLSEMAKEAQAQTQPQTSGQQSKGVMDRVVDRARPAVSNALDSAIGTIRDPALNSLLSDSKYMNENGLTDEGFKFLNSEQMNDSLFGLANAYQKGFNNLSKGDLKFLIPVAGNPQAAQRLLKDPRLMDVMAGKLENSSYRSTWGSLRNRALESEIKNMVGDNVLAKVLTWLAKNVPGLGNWMFRRGMKGKVGALSERLGRMASAYTQPAKPATPPVPAMPAKPATPPAPAAP